MLFNKILLQMLEHEGGYVNDPIDNGGETYKGISRNAHPDIPLWNIIDNIPKDRHIDIILESNKEVQQYVSMFYKEYYWDRMKLDELKNIDYNILNNIFDCSVNLGITQTTKLLQRTCNILNKNQQLISDITVDGVMGPKTIQVIKLLTQLNANVFNKVFNIHRGEFYLNLMRKKPAYEKYIGWFNRVTL